MEAILQRAVSYPPLTPPKRGTQAANGGHLPSSVAEVAETSGKPCNPNSCEFGYDRAARLRSSDAPKQKAKTAALGIPDTKDRDVVAVQLWLF